MIIFTFDVLALPGDRIGERQPSPEGRRLWSTFKLERQPMVLIVKLDEDKTAVEHWLKIEGVRPDLLMTIPDSGPRAVYEAASRARASLGNVHWFVDTDPTNVRMSLEEGMSALLVLAPTIARPDWRGRERLGWEQLTERVEEESLRRRLQEGDDDLDG